MTIKQILKKYQTGELTPDTDESGAGGFWDLAGEIIRGNINYEEMPIIDELQDEIYQALQEVRIEMAKEIRDLEKENKELREELYYMPDKINKLISEQIDELVC